jgi:hypothetical protein
MQTVSNQRRPDSRWGVVRFKAWDLGILVWKFLPQAMTATARVKCDELVVILGAKPRWHAPKSKQRMASKGV